MLLGECGERKRPTVVLSGPPGGGKTTYARMLARDLGLELYSAGRLFREIAAERGISLEELNKLAAQDMSIDLEIDRMTVKVGCRGNVVIEGHLTAWLLQHIADVKMYITASLEERARRIAAREGKSFEEALQSIVWREYFHRKRFMDFYAIDISNLTLFDLVLDTTYLSVEESYSIVKTVACAALRAKGYDLEGCRS
jgi:cytidylate kinase